MPARKKRRLSRGKAKETVAANGIRNSVSAGKAKAVLEDPSLWRCVVTGTTDDVWINLGDGIVCTGGASLQGPAATHAKKTGLGLWLRLNEDDGEDFFSHANETHLEHRDIPKSAQRLLAVLETVRSSARSGSDRRGLGYVTEKIISERQLDDKMSRALCKSSVFKERKLPVQPYIFFAVTFSALSHLEKSRGCQMLCKLVSILADCKRRKRDECSCKRQGQGQRYGRDEEAKEEREGHVTRTDPSPNLCVSTTGTLFRFFVVFPSADLLPIRRDSGRENWVSQPWEYMLYQQPLPSPHSRPHTEALLHARSRRSPWRRQEPRAQRASANQGRSRRPCAAESPTRRLVPSFMEQRARHAHPSRPDFGDLERVPQLCRVEATRQPGAPSRSPCPS